MFNYFYDTLIGKICIGEAGGKLTHIYFEQEDVPNGFEILETPVLKEAANQLEKYFDGKLKVFEIPISPSGTPFMKNVWNCLRDIPYGETASYKDIAVRIGSPNAARAVGLANNRNPIPIIIPCHRVIGRNGSLTGYSGGVDIKEKLLNLEKKYYANF